eukprot:jgi/Mesvir1/27004/Mv25920-RA.1
MVWGRWGDMYLWVGRATDRSGTWHMGVSGVEWAGLGVGRGVLHSHTVLVHCITHAGHVLSWALLNTQAQGGLYHQCRCLACINTIAAGPVYTCRWS